jgi:hypothetical protein
MKWRAGYEVVVNPLIQFLERATDDGRVTSWEIVWPQPRKVDHVDSLLGLPGPIPIPRRSRRGRIFFETDPAHRAAAERILRGEETTGIIPPDERRGVVLVYLSDDRDTTAENAALSEDNIVPLLSIGVPGKVTPNRKDLIQWTVRVKGREQEAAVEIR